MSAEHCLDTSALPDPYRSNLERAGVGHESWPDLPLDEKAHRLDSLVGRTALIPIAFNNIPGTVYAKAELHNRISGSHYDRLAPMIPDLIRKGVLLEGDLVVDTSSGSYTNAVAVLLAAYGIRSRFYIPAVIDGARTALARAAGAELITVNGYIPEASQMMNDDMSALLRSRNAHGIPTWKRDKRWSTNYKTNILTRTEDGQRHVYLNHSANPLVLGKENMGSIADEIANQMQPERLDAMVFAIGNFASIASSVSILQDHNEELLKVGFEEDRNAPCRDEFYGVHPMVRDYEQPRLLGTSAHGTPVAFRNLSLLDAITTVSETQWQEMQASLSSSHPELSVGRTSAAALAVAKIVLRNMDNPAAKIGVILYDDQTKYS